MRLHGNLTEETTEKMLHEFHRHFSLIDVIYVLLAGLFGPDGWMLAEFFFAFNGKTNGKKGTAKE